MTRSQERQKRPEKAVNFEPRAMSRCGRWSTNVLCVLRTLLFGQRVRWRCDHCGEVWWTD